MYYLTNLTITIRSQSRVCCPVYLAASTFNKYNTGPSTNRTTLASRNKKIKKNTDKLRAGGFPDISKGGQGIKFWNTG